MDQETKDAYKLLENAGLKPRIEPIKIFPGDVPERLGLRFKRDSGFTGMDVDYIKTHADRYKGHTNPYEKDKGLPDSIFSYLYGLNHKNHVNVYYDCEDRAFWTMAHVRHRFPGFPIGMISGVAAEGGPGLTGERHALNVLWWYDETVKSYVCSYWDPILDRFVKGINQKKAVIGFPLGAGRYDPIPNNIDPLDNTLIAFDEKRLIYPLDGNGGVSEYLENKTYENPGECKDPHNSIYDKKSLDFQNRWKRYDEALWTFVHVRRAYPGCPIGVAIGTIDGKKVYVNIIWGSDGSGSIIHKYWNPAFEHDDKSGEYSGKFISGPISLNTVFI